jgi:Mg2+ and Co2+ transporter CorA
VLRAASRVLNESVMGFLALAALSAGLAPMLFALPGRLERGLDVVGWAIIALFAAEYLVHLALARDRKRFVLNPWRILDAFIILAPIASLLPVAPEFLRSSPALRVLRLARVVVFGARARRGLASSPESETGEAAPLGPLRVTVLSPDSSQAQERSWTELLQWLGAPSSAWMHAANLDRQRIKEIAARLELPDVMIDAALREASYPRLESSARWCALSLSLPALEQAPRSPLLLLVAERQLLSLSVHPAPLQTPPGFEDLPWGARCALHVVRTVLQRNETLASSIEQELRALEILDPDEHPESFFQTIFRLKRTMALAKGDLWRLRSLLAMLADGRRELPGLGRDQRDCLRALSEQADYLHETMEKAHEQLLTLLDLHLNIASYDVNRFMRLLAVVSSLALIPTIVGGLLGMNVAGNPWPVTLGQIAFGTFILMLCVLYAFMAKGWLR